MRGTRSPPGPPDAVPGPQVWAEYTRNATELVERLRALPKDDHATGAKAARDASGAFAAWTHRIEALPGPLAATAAELSRMAQLRAPRDHGKPVPLPPLAGTAMLFMAAASKDKTAAQTALMDALDDAMTPGGEFVAEELIVQVIPQAGDEFTCYSCFLVRHPSQLASARNGHS